MGLEASLCVYDNRLKMFHSQALSGKTADFSTEGFSGCYPLPDAFLRQRRGYRAFVHLLDTK